MNPLAEKLKQRIEASGPMSVADWMAACLQDPDHGYYMTRDPFGRDGDFVTAPEISQMFGELIGLWAAVVWQQSGSPNPIHLVELGPGRGTLMADALRAGKGAPGFLEAVRAHLVESSPVLQGIQKDTLAGAPGAPTWHGAFDDIPAGPVIIIANEFLDALPVEQYVMTAAGWCTRTVTWTGDGFAFAPGPPVEGVVPDAVRDAPAGSVYEASPAVDTVSGALATRVADDGGAALLIDYGYAEDGLGETLQALDGHAFADPLAQPGERDLTAHVNFANVAVATEAAGARVWGAVDQGVLLERLGLGARAVALLGAATKDQAVEIAAARERLTAPDAMGRLFKALAMTASAAPAPPGFEEVAWA